MEGDENDNIVASKACLQEYSAKVGFANQIPTDRSIKTTNTRKSLNIRTY